jgi:hypothetical protein
LGWCNAGHHFADDRGGGVPGGEQQAGSERGGGSNRATHRDRSACQRHALAFTIANAATTNRYDNTNRAANVITRTNQYACAY